MSFRVFEFLSLLLAAMTLGCAPENAAPIESPQQIDAAVPFVYPIELWDNKISGQTLLLVRISELGKVDSVLIAHSSGYSEFDSAAVQGVRIMRFTPGKQGERRVAMWTRLPVRFARDTTKKMGVGMGTGTGTGRGTEPQ